MTDEAKTTGSEVDSASASAGVNQESQATQPAPKSIFDGFTAEDRAYIENKGWNEDNYVSQSLKAYRNLEKMMGGSKDIVEFPKEGDKEGYTSILKRLGAPDTKEGYAYDTGDDKDKAAMVDALKDVAIKTKMTKSQFNDFVDAFIAKDSEMGKARMDSFIEEKKTQLNEYASEHGREFANIKDRTDRALRMYGINDEERLGLENGIGIKRFYDLFGTIGKHLEEGSLISKANDSVSSTVETYQLELDKLFSNPDFMMRYSNGDAEAVSKVSDLNNKISGAI